jgi:hypothetical protein
MYIINIPDQIFGGCNGYQQEPAVIVRKTNNPVYFIRCSGCTPRNILYRVELLTQGRTGKFTP